MPFSKEYMLLSVDQKEEGVVLKFMASGEQEVVPAKSLLSRLSSVFASAAKRNIGLKSFVVTISFEDTSDAGPVQPPFRETLFGREYFDQE